jgi:hypothetical protein
MFMWTLDHEAAFSTIKSTLVSTPVLALQYFTKEFMIETVKDRIRRPEGVNSSQ